MTPPSDRQPLLAVRDLVKAFGTVRAVDGVSVEVLPNEVLGIIGDNGAGKSTFLSLLAGYHRPDSGTFFYQGKPVAITSPRIARNHLGIEMVYQNLALAPDLSARDNLFLGEEMRVLGVFSDKRGMTRRAEEALRRLESDVSPSSLVGELSGGQRQAVAIGRALLFDRTIIIMDEPTAAISVHKVGEVLSLIRSLKALGKTVLFVSHRLEDVLSVCDRVAVFYQGRIRKVLANVNLQLDDLLREMF